MSRSIRLKTAVPGPRSLALAARRLAAVPLGIGHSTPVYAESARGALLTDVDGNVLIDFAGGIGTLNAGHANPEVVQAAAAALEKFTHSCFSVAPYEGYVALAEKLNAITPGAFPKKTMLANSGAEALENAVKIARHATRREAVVVFEHAFHGRTLLTLSMTSKVRPYKLGFGPFAPEVYRLPFPYEYRGHYAGPAAAAADLEEFFRTQVAAEEVACVVLELVLGEGGFVVAPREYVDALARICRAYGILLVADEVQTGFGRTGRMFACEHYDLEPDLITMAKSLGGGLPISAVTGRAAIMDSAQVGGLGGTYAGNPVACAAALAAIEFIERNRLPERAVEIGRTVEARFRAFVERFPFVGDARGLGAMRALELVKDKTTKEPDKGRADRVIQAAYASGLLLVGAGTSGNVIRTLMPLVITDEELEEGLDVLDHALAQA
ncbi:MAG: 4-aminobutyrate--2-oxoglutarate transaminase [Thermoanaerobaculia bacterium]